MITSQPILHQHRCEKQIQCYMGRPEWGYDCCTCSGLPLASHNPFVACWRDTRHIPPITGPRIGIPGHRSLGNWTDPDRRDDIFNSLMRQPLAAAIRATVRFQSLTHVTGQDIYRERFDYDEFVECHSIVVVGMNIRENYFIIRNSWGENWGLAGYAKWTVASYLISRSPSEIFIFFRKYIVQFLS
ncbi:uncharacterized protein LOC141713741 isoform X2 [Apium graveolens]